MEIQNENFRNTSLETLVSMYNNTKIRSDLYKNPSLSSLDEKMLTSRIESFLYNLSKVIDSLEHNQELYDSLKRESSEEDFHIVLDFLESINDETLFSEKNSQKANINSFLLTDSLLKRILKPILKEEDSYINVKVNRPHMYEINTSYNTQIFSNTNMKLNHPIGMEVLVRQLRDVLLEDSYYITRSKKIDNGYILCSDGLSEILFVGDEVIRAYNDGVFDIYVVDGFFYKVDSKNKIKKYKTNQIDDIEIDDIIFNDEVISYSLKEEYIEIIIRTLYTMNTISFQMTIGDDIYNNSLLLSKYEFTPSDVDKSVCESIQIPKADFLENILNGEVIEIYENCIFGLKEIIIENKSVKDGLFNISSTALLSDHWGVPYNHKSTTKEYLFGEILFDDNKVFGGAISTAYCNPIVIDGYLQCSSDVIIKSNLSLINIDDNQININKYKNQNKINAIKSTSDEFFSISKSDFISDNLMNSRPYVRFGDANFGEFTFNQNTASHYIHENLGIEVINT